jgi:hypothetical protein
MDVRRTQQHHVLFRKRYGEGQRNLFNILRAFANYDMDIGYCQGMANVGAFLLIHFKEDNAFWILVKLMIDYGLGQLYAPGFPSLLMSFQIHERLLQTYLPMLNDHFQRHDLKCSDYLIKWMMNMYLCFPFHTCLQIWDLLFAFGFDILHYTAIGILKCLQKRLFSLGFEDMMKLLTETHRLELDDQQLMHHIKKMYEKYRRKRAHYPVSLYPQDTAL